MYTPATTVAQQIAADRGLRVREVDGWVEFAGPIRDECCHEPVDPAWDLIVDGEPVGDEIENESHATCPTCGEVGRPWVYTGAKRPPSGVDGPTWLIEQAEQLVTCMLIERRAGSGSF